MTDQEKIPIDFLANFFQDRKTCGLGSLSIVAQRMAEEMYGLCDLRAYNTQGLVWMHMPREKSDKVHPSIFRALQRGRGNGSDEKGIDYKHLALYHGHPIYYDEPKQRYYRNIHGIADNYRFKALMTVVESDPLPPEWAENVRGFDMVIVPSKFCQGVVERAIRPIGINIPVVIVPHGVETDIMRPLPDKGAKATNATLRTLHKSPKFKFLMLFTALSFPHRKGVDVALRAFFEEFDGEKDNVMLIIKAENTRELRDEIAKHPGGPEVLVLDERLELDDLVRLYNIADCLLLPSRGEAWALDLSNAIACGLPAIATRWGGMLDYANGYVTWVDVEDKLVSGICYANVHGQYAEPRMDKMRAAMREMSDKNHKKRRVTQVKLSSAFRKDWPWSNAAAKCVEAMTSVYRSKYGLMGVR